MADIPLFEQARGGIAREKLRRYGEGGKPILGVGHLGPVAGKEFRGRTAQEITKGTVDLQEAAVGGREAHSVWRMLKGCAEALFAGKAFVFGAFALGNFPFQLPVGGLQCLSPAP